MTEKKVSLDSLITVVDYFLAVQLGKTEMIQHICYTESTKKGPRQTKEEENSLILLANQFVFP